MWKLPSVASETVLESVSATAKMVSRFFGKDDVRRHFSTGCDWATAGAASMAEPIAETPADRTNFLRFILSFLLKAEVSMIDKQARVRHSAWNRKTGQAKIMPLRQRPAMTSLLCGCASM